MFLNLVILINDPRDLGSQDPSFLHVCNLTSLQQSQENMWLNKSQTILDMCVINHSQYLVPIASAMIMTRLINVHIHT